MHWWSLNTCLYLLLFLIIVGVVVSAFARYLDGLFLVISIANIFACFVFLALATITSDPEAITALLPVALSRLHYYLYGLTAIWVPLTLYILFNSIDRGRRRDALGNM